MTDSKEININKINKKALLHKFSKVKWEKHGKVTSIIGQGIEAFIPTASLGTVVNVEVNKDQMVLCEVVGFKDEKSFLFPFESVLGITPGASIRKCSSMDEIEVGDFLLGGIYDAMLKPLVKSNNNIFNKKKSLKVNIDKKAPNPMKRARITKPLGMGVRAIDAFLTFGQGQRIGVTAGSGVGKSVLMGMIAKGTEADINVIGLIGERGREVKEFLERDLGEEGLKNSVIVCVTSDESPLMKIRGAKVTIAIAEYFSAQGNNVLLMMDSLTRVAMAQREIGLAVGEPPTTKGYPPSVFSLLPKLLERCGPQEKGKGSISGLFTVLVDGDDFNDPIVDAVRSILDGHINLSRSLASRNHFPAIDISTSISRVMTDIVSKEHREIAASLRSLIGAYEEKIDLIQIGGYEKGSDLTLDQAIMLKPLIDRLLKQDQNTLTEYKESILGMKNILQGRDPLEKEEE